MTVIGSYTPFRMWFSIRFFSSDNSLYRDYIKLAIEQLAARVSLRTTVDTRDFVRLSINETLQVDFVNDRVYRHGVSIDHDSGVRLDNLENIAANKICAVIGRDEPKDILDLCTLILADELQAASVMSAAEKKCVLDREVLRARLQSFPVELLTQLAVIDKDHTARLQKDYVSIIGTLFQT